nr:uncharacterized protein LOC100199417 [Hydra vulgaris]
MEFSREETDKRSSSKLSVCLEKQTENLLIKRISSFSKMNPFRLSRKRDKTNSDTKLTHGKREKNNEKLRHSISNNEIVKQLDATPIHPFHDTNAKEVEFSKSDQTDYTTDGILSYNKLFINGDNFFKNFEFPEKTFSKNNLEFQSLTAMINAMKDW